MVVCTPEKLNPNWELLQIEIGNEGSRIKLARTEKSSRV